MRAWAGTRRDRAKRARELREDMARRGVANPHECARLQAADFLRLVREKLAANATAKH